MNKEFRDNVLYGGHAAIVWAGTSYQIYHVFSNQSAQDVTTFWIIAMLIGEIIALPRCLHSPYKVWKLCHQIGAILIGILLVGVIIYG